MTRTDDIRARLAAATPGEWKADSRYLATGEPCPMVTAPDGRVCDALAGGRTDDECMANAAFIAHAPADICALLAENTRLRAALEGIANHCSTQIGNRSRTADSSGEGDEAYNAALCFHYSQMERMARAALEGEQES